jgi:hypothetical protein
MTTVEGSLEVAVQLYPNEVRQIALSADVESWPAAVWHRADREVTRWRAKHPHSVLSFVRSEVVDGFCRLVFSRFDRTMEPA